jgi:hypothetical protein
MAETQTNNTLLAHSAAPPAESTPLAAIQQAISSIRFGVVQITIQDGRIVQIDKTEKIRLV